MRRVVVALSVAASLFAGGWQIESTKDVDFGSFTPYYGVFDKVSQNFIFANGKDVRIYNPSRNSITPLQVEGCPTSVTAGNPTIGFVDLDKHYALVCESLIDPVREEKVGSIDCGGKDCPWVTLDEYGYSKPFFTYNNYVWTTNGNKVEVYTIDEDAPAHYTANLRTYRTFDDCKSISLEEVKKPFYSVSCQKDDGSYVSYIGMMQNSSIAEITPLEINATRVYFDGSFDDAVILAEQSNRYQLYTWKNFQLQPGNSYELDCTREPILDKERGVGYCVKWEQGFEIFDLKTGKELLSDTNSSSNIWGVIPYRLSDFNQNEIGIATWNMIAAKDGSFNGTRLYKIASQEVQPAEENETKPSEGNETQPSCDIPPLTLDKGWSMRGVCFDVNTSIIPAKAPDIEYVWVYRKGDWYFWTPNTSIMQQVTTQPHIYPLHTIKANEGAWLYSAKETTINLCQ